MLHKNVIGFVELGLYNRLRWAVWGALLDCGWLYVWLAI